MQALPSRTCTQCFRIATHTPTSALYRSSIYTRRKLHGTIVPDHNVQRQMRVHAQPSFQNYFSANEALDRGWLKNGVLAAVRSRRIRTRTRTRTNTGTHVHADSVVAKPISSANVASVESPAAQESLASASDTAPHRRRWQRRKETGTGDPHSRTPPADGPEALPLDASSRLTTAAAALPQAASLRRTLTTYLSLSKPRLSFLILLTTTSAYSLYPIPEILSSTHDAAATLSTSTATFLFLTTGTFLSCASANAINMLLEPKSDAKMQRTRNRPLVRGLISPTSASLFAAATAATGLALLYFGTNPTVAALSGINIVLYGFVYTPLKRLHWLNTWVGAVVGGIPPLMGWAAAAGQAATVEHHSWKDLLFADDSTGGWLLAALLFAWQFPHFNSLSHTIRNDYQNAGLKMLAWVNPARNARVAVRYSFLMFPICLGLHWAGLVSPGFVIVSTACNVWMLAQAMRFARYQGGKGSARGLFWASVWQLPLVLAAALIFKTGVWNGILSSRTVAQETEILDYDKDTLGMDSPLPAAANSSAASENQRAHNFAMMGFKRPS